jgi:serine/threonine protein kinase
LLDCLAIAAKRPITSWCMSTYATIPWSSTYLVRCSVDMHIQYILRRWCRLISLLLLLGETDQSASLLEWHKRHAIAIGIAKGLRFLHEECRAGPIIHLDLQPSNVLLTHDFVPMVSWRV